MKDTTIKIFDDFFERYPTLKCLQKQLEQTVEMLYNSVLKNKILICGNGGSAADSEHIAGELLKAFVKKRPISQELRDKLYNEFGDEGNFIADNLQQGIKCIPLTSFGAFSTAFLNDCNEKLLFAQLVNALGVQGDVLIAISTSGNSKNVCYAAQVARALGMKVVAMTGSGGGRLKELSDVLLNVPSDEVYKIQEMHLPVYHLLCLALENECF